ncbi:MAG: integrase arm-type DNA-binding domain-containing protein [Deferrisomatales bacterium]|nr:integrase arm-type DNA-binding domain-containing protein [Deferrisomatales bacterium]
MKRKLTDSHLRTTATPGARRRQLRDGGGLALMIYPTGVRSWLYTYSIDGAKKQLTLGEYPAVSLREARKAHEAAHAQVRDGIDPAEVRRRQLATAAAQRAAQRGAETVATLCDRFIDEEAKKKLRERTWKEYRRQLTSDVVPVLGELKAGDVTQDELIELLEAVEARGAPVAANRLKAVLGAMFKWAKRKRIVRVNPVVGIEPLAAEKPKDRVLTDVEVRQFWTGLDATELSGAVKNALRMILVCAQRPGEVTGMQYEELTVHEGRVIWIIPASRRKNGKTHGVPLSTLALDLIGDREGHSGPVFIGPRGAPVTTHALSVGLRRNIGETDLGPPKKHGKRKRHPIQIQPCTPHDLRRTAATMMSAAGVGGLIKPMLLGHAPQHVTRQVYDLFDYLPEKTRALDAWGRYLARIVAGDAAKIDNVVEFAKAR